MAVYPTSATVELGLQPTGAFREILISELDSVGVWPLSELNEASTRARDISGNHHHGVLTGSGFTRGVVVDLPEGALGMTFDGNGYIAVADDGLSSGINLSLAGGSMDVCCLLKTSTNDATNRAIVQKQVTDATGNGWHLSMQNGAIEWYLKVAGVQIFNFQRGAIADGAEHLIHGYYDPSTQEARLYIDGVQSGATVATTNTDPAYTACDLRIGTFTDGAGDFIGSLAFVSVGREGDAALSAVLQITRAWTDVSADVRISVPIVARYGIPGSTLLDNVASPGTLDLALDNSETNSAATIGYYSPGHASVRSGFRLGIPIRFSIVYGGVTYYKFRGRIQSITPSAGAYHDRIVMVTATDWMDIPARHYISAVAALTDVASHTVLTAALDQLDGRSPAAVAISTGSSTFPFAFDVPAGETEPILTELARTTSSERGYCYIKGDTTQGGTLAWESRVTRQVDTTVDGSFVDTMSGIAVTTTQASLVNIVRVVVTPRRVDAAATTVLYALEVSQQEQPIRAGETRIFEGGYRNPNEESVRVGGVEMITPVAGTDYGFWENSDGTGTNLAANLSVISALGGNSFRLELLNTGAITGYLRLNSSTAFQLRGKGVYHYAPVTVERRDNTSVRRYGPRTVQIDLPYESDVDAASDIATMLLARLAAQVPYPRSIQIRGNGSSALLTHALAREPGDRIAVGESVTGVSSAIPVYIQEVTLTYAAGGIVTAEWACVMEMAQSLWLLGISGFSELGVTTRVGV